MYYKMVPSVIRYSVNLPTEDFRMLLCATDGMWNLKKAMAQIEGIYVEDIFIDSEDSVEISSVEESDSCVSFDYYLKDSVKTIEADVKRQVVTIIKEQVQKARIEQAKKLSGAYR